jgi:hypothetical protein
MQQRLFHFSQDASIVEFTPRSVEHPPTRRPGFDWLNGPLVWAIDGWHQPMYLFPRDCPRILVWPLATTTAADRARYFGSSDARILAYIEERWLSTLTHPALYRYALPVETFESLDDAGMWVSRVAVKPDDCMALGDLRERLLEHGVELRTVATLTPLRDVWASTLHSSGIRLRNAAGWADG